MRCWDLVKHRWRQCKYNVFELCCRNLFHIARGVSDQFLLGLRRWHLVHSRRIHLFSRVHWMRHWNLLNYRGCCKHHQLYRLPCRHLVNSGLGWRINSLHWLRCWNILEFEWSELFCHVYIMQTWDLVSSFIGTMLELQRGYLFQCNRCDSCYDLHWMQYGNLVGYFCLHLCWYLSQLRCRIVFCYDVLVVVYLL